jgi:hypothetical protein
MLCLLLQLSNLQVDVAKESHLMQLHHLLISHFQFLMTTPQTISSYLLNSLTPHHLASDSLHSAYSSYSPLLYSSTALHPTRCLSP